MKRLYILLIILISTTSFAQVLSSMVGGGVVSGATSCNGFSGQLLLSKSIYTPGNGFDWTSEGGEAPDWNDVVGVNVSSVGYQETTYPGVFSRI